MWKTAILTFKCKPEYELLFPSCFPVVFRFENAWKKRQTFKKEGSNLNQNNKYVVKTQEKGKIMSRRCISFLLVHQLLHANIKHLMSALFRDASEQERETRGSRCHQTIKQSSASPNSLQLGSAGTRRSHYNKHLR